MGENEISEINLLVSNIVDQKHYSHCRLCLKSIRDDHYARFQDSIAYFVSNEYTKLHQVIAKIFGNEVSKEIPGIDAICSNCLHKVLQTLEFIYQCEAATEKLHSILDSVNTALNYDTNTKYKDQVLYVVCGEKQSELIFVQNTKEAKKSVQKVNFKCISCKQSYKLLDELKEHNLHQHGRHTCDKCTFTSENETDMVEHELSNDYYKCKECPQFTCTEGSLHEHEDSTHGVHVCQECGKPFRGLDKLLAHEERHDNKNQCPKCAKVYTTKDFFAKHVKLCLEDKVDPHPMRSRYQKTYFCQECGKGYSTPGGLRVHERFVHENAKPHACEQCGKKFTAPCYLKVHMVTHTKEKNFPCDMCTGKFVSKEALLYHRRRHTGEKPYSCDICDEKFVNSSARAEHIKHKHIGPTLSCELCARKFVTKNFLRLHMRKHQDPTNKLYVGRSNMPSNVPGEQNMRVRRTEGL